MIWQTDGKLSNKQARSCQSLRSFKKDKICGNMKAITPSNPKNVQSRAMSPSRARFAGEECSDWSVVIWTTHLDTVSCNAVNSKLYVLLINVFPALDASIPESDAPFWLFSLSPDESSSSFVTSSVKTFLVIELLSFEISLVLAVPLVPPRILGLRSGGLSFSTTPFWNASTTR